MADGVSRWKPLRADRPRGKHHETTEPADKSGLSYPKKKRLKSPQAIAAYRALHRKCEGCGTRKAEEVHHIKSRQAGGDDEASNFLALCAIPCHREWASIDVTRRDWLEARRARMMPDAVEKVERVLRKGLD